MKNFYLSCKECVLEGPRSFYGCFYLGPFNNSQSLTIANALRRTLLSEISGLGILNAQIEGVQHEYSTFIGIRESVLDLLLNLKEIVFCYSSDTNKSSFFCFDAEAKGIKTGRKKKIVSYLQVTGPGIVRASDLKLPTFLKCVDPDQYIATLSENGKLNLKVEISEKFFLNHTQMKNFQSSFNKRHFLKNSKTLKVDSVFSPIKKVNYTIEHYGTLDQNGALDQYGTLNPNNQVIYLELWTNGSIHPRVAFYKALSILNSTFSKLEKMKILNDVYIQSILKSNQNYSKTVKKTLYNFITLPSLSNNKTKADCFDTYQNKSFSSMASSEQIFSKNQFYNSIKSIDQIYDKNFQLTSFEKLKLIYLSIIDKKLINEFSPIQVLNLPFRIENCLIQANIVTFYDLFNKTLNDFKQIPGLSNQSFFFLQKKLFFFFMQLNQTESTK